jgi:hypothetical protein
MKWTNLYRSGISPADFLKTALAIPVRETSPERHPPWSICGPPPPQATSFCRVYKKGTVPPIALNRSSLVSVSAETLLAAGSLQANRRFARVRRPTGSSLLSRSSASLCPALLQLLPQAVGLDQHILPISKLLLPLEAEPAKVGPVPFFALREPLDQFEVDLGAVLLHGHAEGLPGLNLLNSAGMKTGVYRVVIRLTEGDDPRVSEGDEYAFSTRDVRGKRWQRRSDEALRLDVKSFFVFS